MTVLIKGESFGELEFFTGNERNYSIRSKDFCSLLKINRIDFLKLLR